MWRSDWEAASHARNQITALANERRTCAPMEQVMHDLALLLAQLRYDLGLGLIFVGQTLAGGNAAREVSTPRARSARAAQTPAGRREPVFSSGPGALAHPASPDGIGPV